MTVHQKARRLDQLVAEAGRIRDRLNNAEPTEESVEAALGLAEAFTRKVAACLDGPKPKRVKK